MPRKPPAFQFYADDFLSGVAGMSTSERGIYISLLCYQWSKNHIDDPPDFAGDLRRFCGAERDEIDAIQRVVESKFPLCEDGKRRNPRLEEIRELSAKRSRAGISGNKSNKRRKTPAKRPQTPGDGDGDGDGDRRPKKGNAFVPPTREDVVARISEMGYLFVDADSFVSFYESNGWKVGRNRMKNWQATLAGWESRRKTENGAPIGESLPPRAARNRANAAAAIESIRRKANR